MSTTLIGIVSYGGLRFLELALRGIQETVTRPVDILVVVAKPDDSEMVRFLDARGIKSIQHGTNRGFPASVNDLYESAFVTGRYDNLIIMGNDVVPMPGALDAMIECAETTDWEMVCASEFDARFLVNTYPQAAEYFSGDKLVFNDFNARPWELHKDFRTPTVEPNTRKDIRNCTLFTRSSFEKVGYADASFWPNGYFEDNDYGRRCDLLNIPAAGLAHASFFHFWSRTLHQGDKREHDRYFVRNEERYSQKWGGLPGSETKTPELRIADRSNEDAIIKQWSA